MPTYDAFISYSQAKDKPIAGALQSVVQTLGKPWYMRRAVRIFRDDTSLSATPHMWPTLEAALAESRFLILLASAESAHSQWVNKEVSYWLEHKSTDTLLIAVTDGEIAWSPENNDFVWSDATPLPPALKGKYATVPKWVDLRPYRTGASKRDPKFAELGADLAAAIRGIPKEDLLSEEVRQQRRALSLAWSAAALLLVLGVFAAWQWKLALDDKRLAEQQRNRAERTLTAATQTANGLVSDLALKFREIRGIPIDVVQNILNRGKGLLDNLVSFNEGTPAVELIRANAWSELGFTLAQQGDPEGGKLAEEAYRIATKLSHDSPNLDGVTYAMGRAAEVLGQLNEHSNGKAAYDFDHQAIDAFDKCLAKDPKNTRCMRHQFMTLGRSGNILYDNKQYGDALAVYRKSLDLAQSYAKLVPPSPEVGLDMGGRYNHIGSVYFRTQDMANALAQFGQADAAMEPWVNDPKASTSFMLELANTYNNIANVLAFQANAERNRGKLQQAIAYTERSAERMGALAAGDPGNLFYWSNLAIDFDNLSVLNANLGNRGAAEAYARRRDDAEGHAKPPVQSSSTQTSAAQSGAAQTGATQTGAAQGGLLQQP